MEVYIEGGGRKDVHGTEAQFLIEKILRERIYECVYWKEKMFGCNAEIMVDRGADLKAIGGKKKFELLIIFRKIWKSKTD